MLDSRDIAYFSMEFALDPAMPTFSGGLGVLAGDTVRSAADLGVRMVGVHRQGYFFQRLDSTGKQSEAAVEWSVDDFVEELPARVQVEIEGRTVSLRGWKYEVRGIGGFVVPVYLLDVDLPENSPDQRALTNQLYGGDTHYRLCQEVVLGIGGVRLLRALGHDRIERFHMNEGHSALLALELLDERMKQAGRDVPTSDDVVDLRRRCVFTTHTPVPAGHDRFPRELVERVLGDAYSARLREPLQSGDELNMTSLALSVSHYVNGVAKRDGEVSRKLLSSHSIDAITNGVHAATWTSDAFQSLFDRYVPGWREDNFSLRAALGIPGADVWHAHRSAKRELLDVVNRVSNVGCDLDFLTIGFARRMTAYKRPELLFADLDRLRSLSSAKRPIQIVLAGKAHPHDDAGKDLIRRLFAAAEALRPSVRVAYLENYDLVLAKLLVSGCDVWLNTPQPPLEASGTSGMKAALNGVPSLSVLDGWWLEGCIDGVTGWSIGPREIEPDGNQSASDAASLYDRLERDILPCFYGDNGKFVDVMRHAIALNGSFFNTQRMLQQYVVKAYYG
jgi:starch phosphorylase